jgi:hypothetical protein
MHNNNSSQLILVESAAKRMSTGVLQCLSCPSPSMLTGPILEQLCRLTGASDEQLPVTLGSLLQRIKFQAKVKILLMLSVKS